MNLRRILQGVALFCLVALSTNMAQAQTTQLAGINQDGLIQLGANHPFVVSTYELSLAPLGVSTEQDAIAELRKYIDEGFISFSLNMGAQKAIMTIDANKIADVRLTVAQMNDKLRMIHRIRG